MTDRFPNGVYPTMLLPLTSDNQIDFDALGYLIDWYAEKGCVGIFAMCHSTELHLLSMNERLSIVRFVRQKADDLIKRLHKPFPVVCAGTFSVQPEKQADEICAISEAGADAVVWLTNRLDSRQEGDDVWMGNAEILLARLPEKIDLGLYECPEPYKRLLTERILRWAVESNRFYFIKDTCCDPVELHKRLDLVRGTHLKLFNANSQTLLETLHQGACGYSSCMANIHPDLYAWLCLHYQDSPELAKLIQEEITFMTMTEFYAYPLTAKYILSRYEKVPILINSRTRPSSDFDPYNQLIMDRLYDLTQRLREKIQAERN